MGKPIFLQGRPRADSSEACSPAVCYVDLPDAPQLNAYSLDVTEVIRLSERFWQHASTQRFLEANLAGWFIPGRDVDPLFRKLHEAAPECFARYELGGLQSCPDPRGRFEFLEPQRVVLTGADTEDVARLLAGIWHARKRWLNVLPVAEVLRMAEDSSETVPLDIVVVCEPTSQQGQELYDLIWNTGRKARRLFGIVDASPIGKKVDPTPSFVVNLGKVPHLISGDPYDSDVSLQQQLLEAQLMVSRSRYDRRMKPKPSQWETFLPPPTRPRQPRSV